MNPLWTPPWPSIKPSLYNTVVHPGYGDGCEAKLIAVIMGIAFASIIFGGPSAEEAAAGVTEHGEAPVRPIKFKRPLAKSPYRCGCQWPYSTTSAQFLCVTVTFGPPFLERGSTQFRASATHSRVFETDFGSAAYLKAGAEFLWPLATSASGGADLRTMNGAAVSSAFTMHLMDTNREDAFFLPFSPAAKLAVGYIWKRADFPWLGIWEEHHSRANPPWNGQTLARGMEFGARSRILQ